MRYLDSVAVFGWDTALLIGSLWKYYWEGVFIVDGEGVAWMKE